MSWHRCLPASWEGNQRIDAILLLVAGGWGLLMVLLHRVQTCRSARASGGQGCRDRGAELTAVAACLLVGLLVQLAGEVLEPVQCGIDVDQGEIGLDDLQVKVPDVGEDAAHPPGRVVPSLARGSGFT